MEKKTIRWDEDGIQEHDKTRGTRMKISEPKTPYNYYDAEDDEDDEDKNSAAIEDAIPKLEKLKKKQEFESKRAHHYNEFEMLKKFRQAHQDSDDED